MPNTNLPQRYTAWAKTPTYKTLFILVLIFVVLVGGLLVIYIIQGGAPAAATVNGQKILQKEVDEAVEQQKASLEKAYEESGDKVPQHVLDDLPRVMLEKEVQETLLTQHLAKKGIVITEKDVKNYLEKLVVNVSWEGDWEKYEQDLENKGSSLDGVVSTAKQKMIIEKVIEVEGLEPQEFEDWYFKLKEQAEISEDPKKQ